MPEPDLLTADEAAKLLRIDRRTFDGHIAQGDIAYLAVGLGLQRVRKRFAPQDIAWFRERQWCVESTPQVAPSRGRDQAAAVEIVKFRALLEQRRADSRAARKAGR